MSPRWDIHVGRAEEVLPDLGQQFHMAATSPPYWSQRNYRVDEGPQLGHEDTPDLFASALCDVLDVVKEHLRPDGTMWLNIGDTMIGSGGAGGDHAKGGSRARVEKYEGSKKRMGRASALAKLDIPDKNLALVPFRVALEMQARGWYVRSDIIWAKTNCKPEGVKDRPSRSHEYLFLASKKPHYFYDYVAQLEDAVEAGRKRNRRSVWRLNTSTFRGAHFATYPPELVIPTILAGTSGGGVCSECGAPYVADVERMELTAYEAMKQAHGITPEDLRRMAAERDETNVGNTRTPDGRQATMKNPISVIRGYERSCKCATAEPVPATVLDPFSGAASTGIAALGLGRSYVGIERSLEYAELAATRLRSEFPLAPGRVHIHGQEFTADVA